MLEDRNYESATTLFEETYLFGKITSILIMKFGSKHQVIRLVLKTKVSTIYSFRTPLHCLF